jgi:hypothetical protein
VTAGTNVPFRNAAGDLDFLYFADTDGNATTGIVLDDIYVDATSANLANPIPEPEAVVLGFGALLAGWARRRRRRA